MKKLTFEKACETVGATPGFLPNVEGLTEIQAKRSVADYMLDIYHRATNKLENFVPDFSNRGQLKYTAWLVFDSSLGSFVLYDTFYSFTYSDLGARFWFGSTNTAREFFEEHAELVNDLHRYEI